MAKTRLKAPPGTSEANWSGSPKPYPVGLDGTVEVDEGAVAPLLDRGGFTEVQEEEEEPVSAGMATLVHQSGSSVNGSFNGQPFESDEDGVVVVPVEAVEALASHGFSPVQPPEIAAAATEPEPDPEPAAPQPVQAEADQEHADE